MPIENKGNEGEIENSEEIEKNEPTDNKEEE